MKKLLFLIASALLSVSTSLQSADLALTLRCSWADFGIMTES